MCGERSCLGDCTSKWSEIANQNGLDSVVTSVLREPQNLAEQCTDFYIIYCIEPRVSFQTLRTFLVNFFKKLKQTNSVLAIAFEQYSQVATLVCRFLYYLLY